MKIIPMIYSRTIANVFLNITSHLFSKKHLVFYSLFFMTAVVRAQCLLPSSAGDSSFPVTNRYNTLYSIYAHIAYNTGANIFNIASDKGKYYLLGDFANLVQNQGPALVIDSATNTVKTPQKWKVNGTVLTAVPDGQGGFFIGGDFTKIGDSIRKYIAHIDANGHPASWNPKADKIVRTMQKRNDTLYIAGDFTTFLSRPKSCLAMYSITGDSLLRSTVGANSSITSILLLKDTLIYAGLGIRPIRKYNIKDSLPVQWELPYTEFGPASLLQFNEDSTMIIYQSEYNGQTIKAFNRLTSALQYTIGLSMYTPDGFSSGHVFSMKRSGKKIYAVGYFEAVQRQSNPIFARKGFFSFDASTGQISAEDLQADGYPTFIETNNGKLFLSGNFNTVNSVNRLNFAVADTGTLSIGSWQLSPSDELTSLAFYNGTAFIGGHFNGINAVKRNGYAAIDSATGTVLPWSPATIEFTEGKRMIVKGDTIFVLGITGRPSSCMINDFNTAFRIYRLSDGQQLLTSGMGFSKMYDFVIDSGYLYASIDNQLRRFSLPSLTKDLSWGTSYGAGIVPMYLIAKGSKIYSVGDNRFEQPCTTLPERKGWFLINDKATGLLTNYYSYQGNSSYYDQVTFDHALLTNDKMYIQGYFNALNGKARRNFACIDINSGNITNWETPFSQTGLGSSFQTSSDLKLHNGQIWFGSPRFTDTNGRIFPGLGAIDTSTGILMPRLFNLNYIGIGYTGFAKSGSFQDLIFDDSSCIGAGGFDYMDQALYSNLAKLKLVPGSVPVAGAATIIGADTVYTNTQHNRFFITAANLNLYSYNWTYSGSGITLSNNGGDTIWINANSSATSGNLVVSVVNYCGNVQVAQKAIVVAASPPPLPLPVVSGIGNKCFTDPNAFAKLNNPPANVSITISQDGIPLSYNSADSSFRYFTSQQTGPGVHTVLVKYKYTYATMDSISQVFTYTVNPGLIPSINIAGNTTVNSGDSTNLSTATTNAGTNPVYQWQDSTQAHSWQNIAGATNQTMYYKPVVTGDRVRCILTSNALCASPATVASNRLSFVVNITTAINPSPAISKTIRLYPNPARSNIVIDTLKLADNWQSLEIINTVGQKTIGTYSIRNKTSVVIPIEQLNKGIYIVVLRRKGGPALFKTFIKE